jgi:RNA polymerase sigma-70 factor (ECF subfamily)
MYPTTVLEGNPPSVATLTSIEDAPTSGVNWTPLVNRIKAGDADGMEELYAVFSTGIRFYLCRQLGPQDLGDRVHDTFLIVVQAIRRGELRDPECLMGFTRTIVRRQVALYIGRAVHSRRGETELESGALISDQRRDPEEEAMDRQREEIVGKILRGISQRYREILTRFYLMEQTQERICCEMDLNETQFRLLKSRAKARFGLLGKRKLAQRGKLKLP